jgi:transcription initiation factor TFIIE subunit alpha
MNAPYITMRGRKKTSQRAKTRKTASKKNSVLRDILVEGLSAEHVAIIEKLSEPKYDEDVAGELKLKATVVRTLLNDLHFNNLVGYERSKNKKTGWYTYLWNRRDDKIREYIRGYLMKRLDELNKQLDAEKEGLTFNCACKRVPFETALELGFKCPECNEKIVEYDNEEIVDRIVNEISKVNSLLEQTENEFLPEKGK